MGDASDYTGMIRWLERDGVNRFGGVIPGGQPYEADPKGDFFVLEFSKRWNPIDRNVDELRTAIDEICGKTGASGVDIVAHSKGGIDVRTYLMDPDEKAEHVMLLGTPNHGAAMADLGYFARERLSLPVYPPNNDPDATQCLAELSVDSLENDGTPNNPVLLQLNANWPVQRERADFLNVAGAGIPTVGGTVGVSLMGDGLISERSASLPGIPFKRLWFRAHPVLPFSKSVMREMASFFQGKSVSEATDLYDAEP